jgi:hypothetical protein
MKNRIGSPAAGIKTSCPKGANSINNYQLTINDGPVKNLKMAETKNEDCRYQGLFKISSCSKKTFYGTIINN